MSFFRGLRAAALEDGTGLVWGLMAPTILGSAAVAAPISILFYLGRELRKATRLTSIDWDLRDWQAIYNREVNTALEVQYRAHRFRLPTQLAHENTTGLPIGRFDVKFQLNREPYVPSQQVAAHTAEGYGKIMARRSRDPRYYNEIGARALSIKVLTGGISVTVQPVSHNDYIRTNLLLDYRERGRASLRDIVHADGKLEKLEASVLANKIGVNLLVLTADGRVVLQKRSRQVEVRPREYAPTGSGGLTFLDAETANADRFQPSAILREANEEIGLSMDSTIEKTMTYMGTTRELIRGGMPEMFFYAISNQSAAEIVSNSAAARDRHEIDRLSFLSAGRFAHRKLESLDDAHAFSTEMDEIFDRIWNQSSIPLLTSLALWIRQKRLSLARLELAS